MADFGGRCGKVMLRVCVSPRVSLGVYLPEWIHAHACQGITVIGDLDLCCKVPQVFITRVSSARCCELPPFVSISVPCASVPSTQISVRKRSFQWLQPLKGSSVCIHCSTCYCLLSACTALGHSLVCGMGWGEMSRSPLAVAMTCLPVILWTRKETLSLSVCLSLSLSLCLSASLSLSLSLSHLFSLLLLSFCPSQICINLHKDFVQTSNFMHI